MQLKYKNPPIIEALCQVDFSSNIWDLTFPAEFYTQVKADFPEKKTINQQTLGFAFSPQGVNFINENNRADILQCINAEKNSMLQFAQNLLTVNTLKPYMGWENFSKLVLEKFNLYKSIVNPVKIERITLRYINKVNVGSEHNYNNLKQYFNFIPNVPFEFADRTNSLQNICEIPFKEFESILAIQQATLKSEPEMTAPAIFDISFVKLVNQKEFDVKAWLEVAHEKIKHVFDKSFTDFAKKQFNP